jgi:hypothetical protein
MRRLGPLVAVLAVLSLFALVGPSGSAPKKDDGWIPLFNGKDLDGWYTYFEGRAKSGKADDLVRVEDGSSTSTPRGRTATASRGAMSPPTRRTRSTSSASSTAGAPGASRRGRRTGAAAA